MTRKSLGLVATTGLVTLLCIPVPASAQTNPNLGTAGTYSILAGTQVTNVGVTTINGDVGISPGAGGGAPDFNHPGFGTVVLGGTMHDADLQAANAMGDKNTAYGNTAGNLGAQLCTTTFIGAFKELGGATLVPGVYCADRFFLSGTLTLSGTAADVWIFKSAADLIISGGAAAKVVSPSCNVWWRAVSSASFDAGSSLVGNILADTSITLAAGASLSGRAFARTANVTLSSNIISACVAPAAPIPTPTPTPTPAPTPTPIPTPRPNVCATTQPDLFLSKRHSDVFVAGATANYLIEVLNNGTTSSGTITVTDTLPVGMSFVSASGVNWTCALTGPQTVVCTSPASVSQSGNITLTVRPDVRAVPGVTNIAVVTGGGDCDVTNNATTDVTLVAATTSPVPTPACVTVGPDLSITKSHTDLFVTGTNATYSLGVSNRGLASTGAITVIDTLPPGLTYVSAVGVGWTCAAVRQVVTCTTTASVAAGAASTNKITLTVRPDAAAVPGVTNAAAVTGGGDCDVTNNNVADVTAVALPPPVPVPTLSEWAFIMLAVLLAAAGVVALRRRTAI